MEEELTYNGMVRYVMVSFIVLIIAMIIWRIGAYLNKRKRKPKGSAYFKTELKDKWNKR